MKLLHGFLKRLREKPPMSRAEARLIMEKNNLCVKHNLPRTRFHPLDMWAPNICEVCYSKLEHRVSEAKDKKKAQLAEAQKVLGFTEETK